jgi:hypothetical protein
MAEDLLEDTAFYQSLVELAQCVCDEVKAAGLESSICFCGLVGGAVVEPVIGPKGEGMAWVRLVNAYPSTTFPGITQAVNTSCTAPLAAEIEVGITTCTPQPRTSTSNIRAEDWLNAVRTQMAGMAALRRAIECCFPHEDKVLGQWTPIGPQGGEIGGSWRLYIGQRG